VSRREHGPRGERGVTLVETVVATGIAGIAVVVFLAGMSTGLLASNNAERLSAAQELARSQMEHTKSEPYAAAPHAYAAIAAPAGYAVTSTASDVAGGDASVQLITVVVSKDGVPAATLEGLKVDR
jgi:Tfp pilus assembly protein PilV